MWRQDGQGEGPLLRETMRACLLSTDAEVVSSVQSTHTFRPIRNSAPKALALRASIVIPMVSAVSFSPPRIRQDAVELTQNRNGRAVSIHRGAFAFKAGR